MEYSLNEIRNDLKLRNFEETPKCNLCGSTNVVEKLLTEDNCRIVECENCKLWFTSPRLSEEKWEYFIKDVDSIRNKLFTENRLKYGVALERNITSQPNGWRKLKRKAHNKTFRNIMRWRSDPIRQIHEVGCGVGFFLDDMRRKDIEVTGNDLNGYACKVMNERLKLNVWNKNFCEVKLDSESIDLVMMNDYIEHTYHPMEDIKEAYRVLRHEGLIYLQTFMIDSDPFNKKSANWNMLFWNHVYHFSTQSLVRMVETAGFRVKHVNPKIRRGMIEVIGKKA